MKYLGIDFGLNNIGFAVSEGLLAQPLKKNVHIKNSSSSLEKHLARTLAIIKQLAIEHIVVGKTRGPIGQEAKKFGQLLVEKTGLPVDYQEEEFSTEKAVRQMIESGKPKSARKIQNHNVAAANILQDYLERVKSS